MNYSKVLLSIANLGGEIINYSTLFFEIFWGDGDPTIQHALKNRLREAPALYPARHLGAVNGHSF